MSTCAASCSSDDMKNLLKDESQTVKTVKHIKFVKFVLGPGFAPNRWPSSRMELLHLLGAPKWRWRQARRLAMVIRRDDRWDGPGWLQPCLAFSVLVPFNSIQFHLVILVPS